MRLYRVFPYVPSAADDEPGGVFFRSAGGKNRADSPTPGIYRCLYAGDSAEGSIAEAFGRFDTWDVDIIEAAPATPALPGSRFALATYDLAESAEVCVLDDAGTLVHEGLRPSQVVTRERSITQAWAARIEAGGRYCGVSWWSYHDPRWQSVALWDIAQLATVDAPRSLGVDDIEVQRAATAIVRRLITSS
jgi:hypothetical protein